MATFDTGLNTVLLAAQGQPLYRFDPGVGWTPVTAPLADAPGWMMHDPRRKVTLLAANGELYAVSDGGLLPQLSSDVLSTAFGALLFTEKLVRQIFSNYSYCIFLLAPRDQAADHLKTGFSTVFYHLPLNEHPVSLRIQSGIP